MTKSFDELHTEIAQCVSALQYAMYDAQEQGCDLILLIDATTNPGLPLPAVRVAYRGPGGLVWRLAPRHLGRQGRRPSGRSQLRLGPPPRQGEGRLRADDVL